MIRVLAGAMLAGAALAKQPADRQLMDLILLSGVQRSLDATAAAYEKQLKEGVPEEIIKKDGGKLEKAVRDSLSPMRMSYFISRHMLKTLSAGEVDELIKWYRTPTGMKMVDLEVAGLVLMKDEGMLMKRGFDEAATSSKERVDLITQLVKATREGPLTADLAIKVGGASILRIQAGGGAIKPEMMEVFRKRLEDQRPSLEAHFENIGRYRALIALRTATDAEEKQLSKVAASGAARMFNEAVGKGLQDGVLDALENIISAGSQLKRPKGT
jgi:hypothetical protein